MSLVLVLAMSNFLPKSASRWIHGFDSICMSSHCRRDRVEKFKHKAMNVVVTSQTSDAVFLMILSLIFVVRRHKIGRHVPRKNQHSK